MPNSCFHNRLTYPGLPARILISHQLTLLSWIAPISHNGARHARLLHQTCFKICTSSSRGSPDLPTCTGTHQTVIEHQTLQWHPPLAGKGGQFSFTRARKIISGRALDFFELGCVALVLHADWSKSFKHFYLPVVRQYISAQTSHGSLRHI